MKLTLSGFFHAATTELGKNKTRSFLTMLGIVIGVSSVILLVAIGNGLKYYIQQEFESLGSNMVFIMPGQVFKEGEYRPGSDMSTIGGILFDEKDMDNISKIDGVAAVSPLAAKSALASYGKENFLIDLTGVSADFLQVRSLDINQGRFFSESEARRGANVAVLGHKVKEELFGDQEAVGEKITVEGEKYRVVGVAAKLGGMAGSGGGFDERVYVPYRVVFRLTGRKDFAVLIFAAEDREKLEEVKGKAEALLLERYSKEDFSLVDQEEILSTISSVLGVMTLGLAGIAAISLLVGGVGIMNIMFVSVTERIKEVGLRKAVGATSKDILWQFLIEAVVMSLCGGLIGIALSVLAVIGINVVFPAKITLWSVALAFGVSSLIGIIFGVAPARRAASLSPIEALRYE